MNSGGGGGGHWREGDEGFVRCLTSTGGAHTESNSADCAMQHAGEAWLTQRPRPASGLLLTALASPLLSLRWLYGGQQRSSVHALLLCPVYSSCCWISAAAAAAPSDDNNDASSSQLRRARPASCSPHVSACELAGRPAAASSGRSDVEAGQQRLQTRLCDRFQQPGAANIPEASQSIRDQRYGPGI